MQIEIEEEQRQLIVMALAHLAMEYPGWEHACSTIALKMDHTNPERKPDLYERFKTLNRRGVRFPVPMPQD